MSARVGVGCLGGPDVMEVEISRALKQVINFCLLVYELHYTHIRHPAIAGSNSTLGLGAMPHLPPYYL